jgi:Spy/CpxP family protein refolding chaperone
MKRSLIILAVIFASTAVVASANAFQHSDPGGMYQKFGFKQYLNLSEEQVAKMKDLRNRFRTETRDMRYNLAIKRIEMQKLFTDPNTDDIALFAKQKEIDNLRMLRADKRAQLKIEWRKILTPEQIAKLDSIPPRWHQKGF